MSFTKDRKPKADYTRHLSTDGNLGFVPTGTPLYRLVKTARDGYKKLYNVPPQGLVMWVGDADCADIPLTIEPADLTVQDLYEIHIGVGYDGDGDGVVETIRELSPGFIQGCTFDTLDAYGPKCAVPEIKAIYPECVSCDTITAVVQVYDNSTLSFSDNPLKAYEEIVASFTPDCGSCNGCPQEVTCDEVVCGLVDALNGEVENKFGSDGEPYPHTSPNGWGRDLGVEFFKLHTDGWKSYCISPEVGTECTECNAITALTTYTIDGVAYNFDLLNPSNNTQTLVSQMDAAVELINQTFRDTLGRHSGRAILTRGEGKCCPFQIFVNTCDPTFEIAGLTECTDAINQFPDFVSSGVCKQCGTNEETTTPSCGIAAIAKQDTYPCNCWELNQPLQFYGRSIVRFDIISPSGAFDNRWSKKATLLEGQQPSNFGSQIQFLEFSQRAGGEGFDFEQGDSRSGWLGLPDKNSRLRKAIKADCNKSYCSFYWTFRAKEEYASFGSIAKNLFLEGFIHVPQNDDTTKTALVDLNKKILELVPTQCKVLSSIDCEGNEVLPNP